MDGAAGVRHGLTDRGASDNDRTAIRPPNRLIEAFGNMNPTW